MAPDLHQIENPECHIYAGRLNENGYGRDRNDLIHRFVLEEKLGRPIKPGYVAMHTCDTPWCIFEGHLREGTRADNNADRDAKGRQVCLRGDAHPSRTRPETRPRGDAHFSRAHPEKLSRGECHYKAKLTEQDVRIIRAILAKAPRGTAVKLAELYGVDRTLLSKIKLGKIWKHIL